MDLKNFHIEDLPVYYGHKDNLVDMMLMEILNSLLMNSIQF